MKIIFATLFATFAITAFARLPQTRAHRPSPSSGNIVGHSQKLTEAWSQTVIVDNRPARAATSARNWSRNPRPTAIRYCASARRSPPITQAADARRDSGRPLAQQRLPPVVSPTSGKNYRAPRRARPARRLGRRQRQFRPDGGRTFQAARRWHRTPPRAGCGGTIDRRQCDSPFLGARRDQGGESAGRWHQRMRSRVPGAPWPRLACPATRWGRFRARPKGDREIARSVRIMGAGMRALEFCGAPGTRRAIAARPSEMGGSHRAKLAPESGTNTRSKEKLTWK